MGRVRETFLLQRAGSRGTTTHAHPTPSTCISEPYETTLQRVYQKITTSIKSLLDGWCATSPSKVCSICQPKLITQAKSFPAMVWKWTTSKFKLFLTAQFLQFSSKLRGFLALLGYYRRIKSYATIDTPLIALLKKMYFNGTTRTNFPLINSQQPLTMLRLYSFQIPHINLHSRHTVQTLELVLFIVQPSTELLSFLRS